MNQRTFFRAILLYKKLHFFLLKNKTNPDPSSLPDIEFCLLVYLYLILNQLFGTVFLHIKTKAVQMKHLTLRYKEIKS